MTMSIGKGFIYLYCTGEGMGSWEGEAGKGDHLKLYPHQKGD